MVVGLGSDGIGTELRGQRAFAVADVDGADMQADDLGVLYGEVSKVARAGDAADVIFGNMRARWVAPSCTA
jgi:TRAP-type uncharacterized transport system substrate-binding protein